MTVMPPRMPMPWRFHFSGAGGGGASGSGSGSGSTLGCSTGVGAGSRSFEGGAFELVGCSDGSDKVGVVAGADVVGGACRAWTRAKGLAAATDGSNTRDNMSETRPGRIGRALETVAGAAKTRCGSRTRVCEGCHGRAGGPVVIRRAFRDGCCASCGRRI